MRRNNVYYKEHLAGIVTETDEGEYIFQYNEQYVKEHPSEIISFTMPVTDQPYIENRLFPFFEGLIPEGWLLDIASKNWKIKRDDRMGLLHPRLVFVFPSSLNPHLLGHPTATH
jgi:serine/threonine-protein kinase HipA